jgi:hypothetical protein
MQLSRIVGILALVAQVGNLLTAVIAPMVSPETALIISGVLAGISAFTGRVQGVSEDN